MERELYRPKDDDSDEDEKPKKKLPFGVAKPKAEDAEPKPPIRPTHRVLGEGIIELRQDEPSEAEGHLYRSSRLFLHGLAQEELTEDLVEDEEDEEEETEEQAEIADDEQPDSQPALNNIQEQELIVPTEDEEAMHGDVSNEAGAILEDLPSIAERDQSVPEETMPVAQDIAETVPRKPMPPTEGLHDQQSAPETVQPEAFNADVPPYRSGVAPWSAAEERLPYVEATTPIERPVKQATEHVSEGDPRFGPLAFLLGMEYFARKRAIRKLEKKTEKRMDEKFAQYSSSPKAERLSRDTYMSMKPETGLPTVERERIAAEAADDALERINLQHNQHVEQSAWHSFAVDKYGHIVNDAIHYGEGFQREQQQEVRRRDQLQKAPSATPILIPEMPTMASPSSSHSSQSSLPSGMTTPALPEGVPLQVDSQHRLPASKKQDVNQVWLWLLLLLILAAILTALFS